MKIKMIYNIDRVDFDLRIGPPHVINKDSETLQPVRLSYVEIGCGAYSISDELSPMRYTL